MVMFLLGLLLVVNLFKNIAFICFFSTFDALLYQCLFCNSLSFNGGS